MSYIPLEKCLDNSGGSIYKLTVMVAKRAQELAEGAKPLAESTEALDQKPIRMALKEVVQGYLKAEKVKAPKA
ncbi:MAG: DNA-directed RNA polymerase subunit omega [Candidatus Omnitrophica bacterium]|nr:DNA-directed RNA polymerase subunit omega [Candidatus Omnitrophota bacterium]